MEYRILIAGSRDFTNYDFLESSVSEFLKGHQDKEIIIISGAARGADKLGERYAQNHGLKVIQFFPDWSRYGKRAGHIRNTQMLEYIQENNCACAVLAFWDGESRGTKDTITTAQNKGIETKIFRFTKEG